MRTSHRALAFTLALAALGPVAGCQTTKQGDPAAAPAAAKPASASAAIPKDDRSLFERLGGRTGIEAVVERVLTLLWRHPKMAGRFEGANRPRLQALLSELVVDVAGGPAKYSGIPLKKAHMGMRISDREYDLYLALFSAAARDLKVPDREAGELAAYMESVRDDIVDRRTDTELKVDRVLAQLDRIERRLDALEAGPSTALRTGGGGAAAASPEMAAKKAAMLKASVMEGQGAAAFRWSDAEIQFAKRLLERMTKPRLGTASSPDNHLVGRSFERTQLFSYTGEVIDLKDYRGKQNVCLVILRGFSGTVCIHCSTQTLALKDAVSRFRALGCELVLCYPGPARHVPTFLAAVRQLSESFDPPFPIVLDVDLSITDELGLRGSLASPTSLLIDRQGVIRYAYIGRQPQDRPSVEDLLAVAESLRKGR